MRAKDMWTMLDQLRPAETTITLLMAGSHVISGLYRSHHLSGQSVKLFLSSGVRERTKFETWIFSAGDLVAVRTAVEYHKWAD